MAFKATGLLSNNRYWFRQWMHAYTLNFSIYMLWHWFSNINVLLSNEHWVKFYHQFNIDENVHRYCYPGIDIVNVIKSWRLIVISIHIPSKWSLIDSTFVINHIIIWIYMTGWNWNRYTDFLDANVPQDNLYFTFSCIEYLIWRMKFNLFLLEMSYAHT